MKKKKKIRLNKRKPPVLWTGRLRLYITEDRIDGADGEHKMKTALYQQLIDGKPPVRWEASVIVKQLSSVK